VTINSQPLGRIVAGDNATTFFISLRQWVAGTLVHCAFSRALQTNFYIVAGLGAVGPSGPRTGTSSGMLPGSSSGKGDSPGSRTGGGMSGCGLPGGASCGGSVGFPGVAGGISGGSMGMPRQRHGCSDVP
jgi:hypothetical protein